MTSHHANKTGPDPQQLPQPRVCAGAEPQPDTGGPQQLRISHKGRKVCCVYYVVWVQLAVEGLLLACLPASHPALTHGHSCLHHIMSDTTCLLCGFLAPLPPLVGAAAVPAPALPQHQWLQQAGGGHAVE